MKLMFQAEQLGWGGPERIWLEFTTGDLKVCVVFSYQAEVVFRSWAQGARVGYAGRGWEVLGWQFIGASYDMCCPDVSSHSSTDQVKGVMTLQGDALCQAVSTCHTSCFVLQGGRSPWLCITSDQYSLSVLPNWPRCFTNHWNLSRSRVWLPLLPPPCGGGCCSQLPLGFLAFTTFVV